MNNACVLSYPLSAQQSLWSDWADAQADLSLRWAQTHFVGFVMSKLNSLRGFLRNWLIIAAKFFTHVIWRRLRSQSGNRGTTALTRWLIFQVKIQICLRIQIVWSEFLAVCWKNLWLLGFLQSTWWCRWLTLVKCICHLVCFAMPWLNSDFPSFPTFYYSDCTCLINLKNNWALKF